RIKIEIVFLDVFAVIALAVGKAKHPFFQDWVAPIPECEREAQPLFVVAPAGDAILTPVIGAGARLVVGEVTPGVAVLAIIFANRSPLPLAEIRPPQIPRGVPAVALS